jgi:hypothetical protein
MTFYTIGSGMQAKQNVQCGEVKGLYCVMGGFLLVAFYNQNAEIETDAKGKNRPGISLG